MLIPLQVTDDQPAQSDGSVITGESGSWSKFSECTADGHIPPLTRCGSGLDKTGAAEIAALGSPQAPDTVRAVVVRHGFGEHNRFKQVVPAAQAAATIEQAMLYRSDPCAHGTPN